MMVGFIVLLNCSCQPAEGSDRYGSVSDILPRNASMPAHGREQTFLNYEFGEISADRIRQLAEKTYHASYSAVSVGLHYVESW